MAAKSGVVWAPGRSFWAADVRDVARGTCRAGGLRLGPVGAARHLPGPTIGLDAPFPAATAQGAAPVFFSFLRRCLEPFGGYWELGLLLAVQHREAPGPGLRTLQPFGAIRAPRSPGLVTTLHVGLSILEFN